MTQGSNRQDGWVLTRGGMLLLKRPTRTTGKLAVPKPVNLPSIRKENAGNDPTTQLVPGGPGWASKGDENSAAQIPSGDSNAAPSKQPSLAATSSWASQKPYPGSSGWQGPRAGSAPFPTDSRHQQHLSPDEYPSLSATSQARAASSLRQPGYDYQQESRGWADDERAAPSQRPADWGDERDTSRFDDRGAGGWATGVGSYRQGDKADSLGDEFPPPPPPRRGGFAAYDYPPPPPPPRRPGYDPSYGRGFERYDRLPGFQQAYDPFEDGLLPLPRSHAATAPLPMPAEESDPEREAFEAELRREVDKRKAGDIVKDAASVSTPDAPAAQQAHAHVPPPPPPAQPAAAPGPSEEALPDPKPVDRSADMAARAKLLAEKLAQRQAEEEEEKRRKAAAADKLRALEERLAARAVPAVPPAPQSKDPEPTKGVEHQLTSKPAAECLEPAFEETAPVTPEAAPLQHDSQMTSEQSAGITAMFGSFSDELLAAVAKRPPPPPPPRVPQHQQPYTAPQTFAHRPQGLHAAQLQAGLHPVVQPHLSQPQNQQQHAPQQHFPSPQHMAPKLWRPADDTPPSLLTHGAATQSAAVNRSTADISAAFPVQDTSVYGGRGRPDGRWGRGNGIGPAAPLSGRGVRMHEPGAPRSQLADYSLENGAAMLEGARGVGRGERGRGRNRGRGRGGRGDLMDGDQLIAEADASSGSEALAAPDTCRDDGAEAANYVGSRRILARKHDVPVSAGQSSSEGGAGPAGGHGAGRGRGRSRGPPTTLGPAGPTLPSQFDPTIAPVAAAAAAAALEPSRVPGAPSLAAPAGVDASAAPASMPVSSQDPSPPITQDNGWASSITKDVLAMTLDEPVTTEPPVSLPLTLDAPPTSIGASFDRPVLGVGAIGPRTSSLSAEESKAAVVAVMDPIPSLPADLNLDIHPVTKLSVSLTGVPASPTLSNPDRAIGSSYGYTQAQDSMAADCSSTSAAPSSMWSSGNGLVGFAQHPGSPLSNQAQQQAGLPPFSYIFNPSMGPGTPTSTASISGMPLAQSFNHFGAPFGAGPRPFAIPAFSAPSLGMGFPAQQQQAQPFVPTNKPPDWSVGIGGQASNVAPPGLSRLPADLSMPAFPQLPAGAPVSDIPQASPAYHTMSAGLSPAPMSQPMSQVGSGFAPAVHAGARPIQQAPGQPSPSMQMPAAFTPLTAARHEALGNPTLPEDLLDNSTPVAAPIPAPGGLAAPSAPPVPPASSGARGGMYAGPPAPQTGQPAQPEAGPHAGRHSHGHGHGHGPAGRSRGRGQGMTGPRDAAPGQEAAFAGAGVGEGGNHPHGGRGHGPQGGRAGGRTGGRAGPRGPGPAQGSYPAGHMDPGMTAGPGPAAQGANAVTPGPGPLKHGAMHMHGVHMAPNGGPRHDNGGRGFDERGRGDSRGRGDERGRGTGQRRAPLVRGPVAPLGGPSAPNGPVGPAGPSGPGFAGGRGRSAAGGRVGGAGGARHPGRGTLAADVAAS